MSLKCLVCEHSTVLDGEVFDPMFGDVVTPETSVRCSIYQKDIPINGVDVAECNDLSVLKWARSYFRRL